MLTNLDGSPITLAHLRGAYVRAMTTPAESTRRDANAARATLTERGYTIRAAAAQLGCGEDHLSLVLAGRRRSSAALAAVHGLPSRRITSAQMIELLARMEIPKGALVFENGTAMVKES